MIKKLEKIIDWCKEDARVKALFLVGSYSRNTQKPDSDIDLVIVTNNKESLFNLDWVEIYGSKTDCYIEEYGACTSVRVFYENKTEIEYGIVELSWLDHPLDEGTKRVLQDGYILLYGVEDINQIMIDDLIQD